MIMALLATEGSASATATQMHVSKPLDGLAVSYEPYAVPSQGPIQGISAVASSVTGELTADGVANTSVWSLGEDLRLVLPTTASLSLRQQIERIVSAAFAPAKVHQLTVLPSTSWVISIGTTKIANGETGASIFTPGGNAAPDATSLVHWGERLARAGGGYGIDQIEVSVLGTSADRSIELTALGHISSNGVSFLIGAMSAEVPGSSSALDSVTSTEKLDQTS